MIFFIKSLIQILFPSTLLSTFFAVRFFFLLFRNAAIMRTYKNEPCLLTTRF